MFDEFNGLNGQLSDLDTKNVNNDTNSSVNAGTADASVENALKSDMAMSIMQAPPEMQAPTNASSVMPQAESQGMQPGMPQEVPQGMPPGMPQGAPQEMMPQGMPQGAPQGMQPGMPQEVPQGRMPQGMLQGEPQGMPPMMPQGMPQEAPQGRMPQGMLQGAPQGMQQGMPQGAPQGMPQGMPQEAPQGMQQGMPQEAPQERMPGMPPTLHDLVTEAVTADADSPMQNKGKKKKKKKSGTGKVVFSVFLGIVIGIGASVGAFFAAKSMGLIGDISVSPEETESENSIPDTNGTVENQAGEGAGEIATIPNVEVKPQVLDASSVAENCMPSIVAITNIYTETYQGFFGSEKYQNESTGSGIIVGQNDEELLIVTNSHVISSSDSLSITFADGQNYDALVKGSKGDQDLAVVAVKMADISKDTLDAIKIAKLGDSDTLKVGEPAIAIGNALGYGQTVTMGIISALDREFSFESIARKVIQTDAAINPGNSGGALLNIKGEVIGINEAKYSSTSVEGVGYAIPISSAKPIIDELMSKETHIRSEEEEPGYLGIAGVDVKSDVASMYGMPIGVYVAQVTEGSAAEAFGIQKGDIITEFDGISVSSMEALRKLVSSCAAGTTVDVVISRMSDNGYETQTLSVELGKKID